MKIQDFNIGDILLVTSKTRNGYETRIAQVSEINFRNNGLITYQGYYNSQKDFLQTGQGAFDPEKIGKKPFGTISICVIDSIPPSRYSHWSPRPGDRGYDLMC